MNTITANELKTHLYIVAADGMEGRETGSAGQKKLEFTLSINMLKIIFLFQRRHKFYQKSLLLF
jgi:hypothetical protein